MEKLVAISARLSPREAAIAHEVALRMTDEQRTAWLAELDARSIDEGVAFVRSMIPPDIAASPPASSPTVTPPVTPSTTRKEKNDAAR
jgi:hypothetical protein